MTPTDLQKIDAAIAAHGQWLVRLRTAIESGASDFKPDIVAKDNQCEFGKWLYSDFPKEFKNSNTYDEIRGLHASFHKAASQILSMATSGKKAEAVRLMDHHGDFMRLSGTLVIKLRAMKGG